MSELKYKAKWLNKTIEITRDKHRELWLWHYRNGMSSQSGESDLTLDHLRRKLKHLLNVPKPVVFRQVKEIENDWD